eukprot:Skav217321  [mRNA]  locus=scaffold3163:410432:410833:+ [translate_table: standard]
MFPQGIQHVMAKQKHVLLPHHLSALGGNDPSEMLVVGPRLLFERCLATGEQVKRMPCGIRQRSWNGWACGYFATHFIYWAYSQGIMPFFYFTKIKLHLLRMNGKMDIGRRQGQLHELSDAYKTNEETSELHEC